MTARKVSQGVAVLGDLVDDERVSIADLALRLRVSISSIQRWSSHGVRGVRLSTLRIGARRFVTAKEARLFMARLNQGKESPSLAASEPRAGEVGHG